MKKSTINTIFSILVVVIFVGVISYVIYFSMNYIDKNHTVDIYKKYFVNPIEYNNNHISGLKDEYVEIKVNNLLSTLSSDTNCEVTFNYSNVFAVSCDKYSKVIDLTTGELLELKDIFRANYNISTFTTKDNYTWGIANTYFWINDGKVKNYALDKYLNNVTVFDKYITEKSIYKNPITDYIYPFEDIESDLIEFENKKVLLDIKVFSEDKKFDSKDLIKDINKILVEYIEDEDYHYLRGNVIVNKYGNYDKKVSLEIEDFKSLEYNNFVSSLFKNYDNSEKIITEYNDLYIDEDGKLTCFDDPSEKIEDFEIKLNNYFLENDLEVTEYIAFYEELNNRVAIYYEDKTLYIELDYFVDK